MKRSASAPHTSHDDRPMIDRLVTLVVLRLAGGGIRVPIPNFKTADSDLQDHLTRAADGIMAMLGDPARHAGDPLVRIAAAYGLSALEMELLAFALAPHCDERIGTLFQAISGARRMTVADAFAFVAGAETDRMALRRHLQGSRLWRFGLLVHDGADFFERRLIAHPAVPLAVNPPAWGEPFDCGNATASLLDSRDVPDTFLGLDAQAEQLAQRFATRPFKGLSVDATAPHHARALARAFARKIGAPLLVLQATGQSVEDLFETAHILAAAWGVVPLIDVRSVATEVRIPDAPATGFPTLLAARPNLRLRSDLKETADAGYLPVSPVRPSAREREALWWSLLGVAADEATERDGMREAIACFALRDPPVEAITRCLDEARAMVGPGESPTPDHLHRAFAGLDALPPTAFGNTVWAQVPWSALVLDAKTLALLDDVVHRVHHRARVYEDWRMDAPRTSGVVTLLHGEAGTGKTHAVEAIATRLAMPLLKVDLSTVVSKYIGETEKHLAELFELAQGFRAILFFDEADALFAKRTGVSDSHDRYANLETNYLLQRVEAFDQGVVFLATNLKRNMDDAFVRRIGVSIHVPRPSPLEQMALWTLHVPQRAQSDTLDFGRVVERFDLVGGEIRNCALTAAFAAAADGSRITMHHLERAIFQELEKMGRPVPQSAFSIAQIHPRTTSQAQAGRSSCRH